MLKERLVLKFLTKLEVKRSINSRVKRILKVGFLWALDGFVGLGMGLLLINWKSMERKRNES